jgi:type I site-specific restriction endonuclease
MLIANLIQILQAEATAFHTVASLEKKLQDALMDKDFGQVEQIISEIDVVAQTIQLLDDERETEYQYLRESSHLSEYEGLSELFSLLPAKDREKLVLVYREFKVAVMEVQFLSTGIDSLSRHQIQTLRGVLDELYPDRKSRTYTARGIHREFGSPLVLDHSL